MNQIIIDNRHKIDTACSLCFSELEKYNNDQKAFHDERSRVNALPYIQSEKEKMVNDAATALAEKANRHYNEIHSNLEDIRAAALEMESLMDIGEDLQNALSVVKTLGKDVPFETRSALVEPFKGQRQALVILKAAYEGADLGTEPYFKGLVIDTAKEVDKLDDEAYSLVGQAGKNILPAFTFAKNLEGFADVLGVKLTKRFSDMVDGSEARNEQMRAVMGLSSNN